MVIKLFLLFTIIPFIELALLIEIGKIIGTIETVLVIIITGVAGAVMVRQAGIQCVFRIQKNLNEGVIPTDELFTGILILVSGAFLITPGFLTDSTGFLLLFPPTRNIVKIWLKKIIQNKINRGGCNTDIHFHR